jgi:short-subunit dehydrogenase
MIQAFLPALSRSRGAIVNILSRNSLAPIPVMPAYSISKAAAFSLTQSLRVLLAGQGLRVHAVLPGPVDTDMLQGVDIPKTSPESVAAAVFDAMDNEEDDIFPDPASAFIADSWRDGATKALERQMTQAMHAAP